MAKLRPKKKTQKKIDPLTVSLKLLALADRECVRAIRSLSKAIITPAPVPKIVDCGFKLHKKKYRARVTVDQCEKILEAVGKKDATDLNDFGQTLGVQEKSRPKSGPKPASPSQPIPLGCCIYTGGMTPNLTQSQCQQFNPTQWDQGDPNCSAIPPN
jgi:hypothetical protein